MVVEEEEGEGKTDTGLMCVKGGGVWEGPRRYFNKLQTMAHLAKEFICYRIILNIQDITLLSHCVACQQQKQTASNQRKG